MKTSSNWSYSLNWTLFFKLDAWMLYSIIAFPWYTKKLLFFLPTSHFFRCWSETFVFDLKLSCWITIHDYEYSKLSSMQRKWKLVMWETLFCKHGEYRKTKLRSRNPIIIYLLNKISWINEKGKILIKPLLPYAPFHNPLKTS